MANTSSARKRIRTNERKRVRNQMYRSRTRTLLKKAEQMMMNGEADESVVREAVSVLDKAAGKGVIHRNSAARHKSRLMLKLNELRKAQA